MAVKGKDWAVEAARYTEDLTKAALRELAKALGVSRQSLQALGLGWRDEDECWTFPEYDGAGEVIGILRRFKDGDKQAVGGSQRGLYLPRGWQGGDGVIFVPEGPSDVAALLTVGLRAVGRPSCQGGLEHLAALLAETDDEVVIVGENDRKDDGKWPGGNGAKKLAAGLARELGGRVRWTMPPKGFKDVREWLLEGGTDGD